MPDLRSSTKPNPPYLLGLLCLIPFLGAIGGLILIIIGLAVYQNKWLVLIGTVGIVLNIILIVSIVSPKLNPEIRTGFEEISKKQINNVVAHIEFYKLQHGAYPDSLQQLLEFDPFTSIHDISGPLFSKESTIFNYEKVDDKYILFSSGRDQKPYTDDDFYPIIQIPDSSRIGLIAPSK